MEPENIHQAKNQLSQLLHWVEHGGGDCPSLRSDCTAGAMRSQIQISADFDVPLDGLFEALQ